MILCYARRATKALRCFDLDADAISGEVYISDSALRQLRKIKVVMEMPRW